jgi:serine/threonine protein kinase
VQFIDHPFPGGLYSPAMDVSRPHTSTSKVCPRCGAEYPANARFCETDGTALRVATGGTDLEGSIVADRYLILRKLGEGGMGRVYLAEHVKMGRKSALKVLHPGMVKDLDAITRFNREAANASRISHPNVAAVYDFGETADGLIYLAMEYVDGESLARVIEKNGPLSPRRAGEIVRQTADALAVAHEVGLVHRDLKPDNILLVATRDGGDLVKVVDFGIAKAADDESRKVTKTGFLIGTPDYMSPEQFAGDALDGRSDIYSLGLVAFNMLTGRLPFPSESARESLIMRLTDAPMSLRLAAPSVDWPDDVQEVIDKALARDPARRYQSAGEFGQAFHAAVSRMPETIAQRPRPNDARIVPPTRVVRHSGEIVKLEDRYVSTVGLLATLVVILTLATVVANRDSRVPKAAVGSAPTQARPTVPDNSGELTRLDSLANDSTTAASALAALSSVPLSSDEDRVHAALVRFTAGLSLRDKNACNALREVRTIAPGTTKATLVAAKLTDLCSN